MSKRARRLATMGAAIALSVCAALFLPSVPSPRTDAPAVADDAERSARARWHEAERLYGAESPEAGAALLELVQALQRLHRGPEGIPLARRAVEIMESCYGPEHAEVARALEVLAMSLWDARDLESERSVVERALALRERAVPRDESTVALDLHFLSELYRVEGDYGRALQLGERVGPLFERLYGPSNQSLAVHLHYLAVIQAAIGDRGAAVANAQRAVDMWEEIQPPMPSQLARSLNLLGGLLVGAGKLNRAEPMLQRARSIWEASRSGDPSDSAFALTNLGRLYAARQDHARAAEVFERVALIRSSVVGREHPLFAVSLAQLGAEQRRLGDRARARSSLQLALGIQETRSTPSYPEWASVLRELALLDADEGHLDTALKEALVVERLTREHFRASSLGLSEREALTQARSRVGGLDLAWAWASELASRGALDGDAASAILDQSIQSRALVLDTLATRRRILALHQDDETTASVETLRRAEQRLTHLLTGDADPESSAAPDQLTSAQAEADRAERALAEKSREYREERDRGDPDLDDVRAALPPRAALISYVQFPTAYAACILVAGTEPPRIVPLGTAADIDRAVRAWGEGVSRDPRPRGIAASEAEYSGVARRLAATIWDPLLPFLNGVERVFVVPDGALQEVNLATLVTERGRYLVESGVSFHYLTAERDLVGYAGIAPLGQGLLALGDPAYGAPGGPMARRFDPLPGSRREALEVASLWPERERMKLLTGDEADEATFKRLAPSFRVLHIATHAFFQSGVRPGDSPLRVAGLAMAGANRKSSSDDPSDAEDGILTAEEIALLDLRGVEWAVLSACATGQGVVVPGEGILGLRRAVQIAGAHTLVVSLWPVEDDATRYWMRALYASRRTGASTIDAVRVASRGVLEDQRRSGGTTHPYFWGGFVSIGDWR